MTSTIKAAGRLRRRTDGRAITGQPRTNAPACRRTLFPGARPEKGRKVIAHRFTGGTGGSEVWLYEIVGGKHSWGEQDIDTGEELWKFFSKFVK